MSYDMTQHNGLDFGLHLGLQSKDLNQKELYCKGAFFTYEELALVMVDVGINKYINVE